MQHEVFKGRGLRLCAGVHYLKNNGVKTLWQSMLRFPAGALKLNNYPATLRNIVPEVLGPNGKPEQLAATDMAAMEIYRDRERGVPRYNEFRKWYAQNIKLAMMRKRAISMNLYLGYCPSRSCTNRGLQGPRVAGLRSMARFVYYDCNREDCAGST